MILKAKYAEVNGEECYLNTNYVVDVFNEDDNTVAMTTIDMDRGVYFVSKSDLYRWVKEENDA